MDMTEKKLSGERRYTGLVVSVDVDQIVTPGGNHAQREIVRHPGGVAVVPVTEEGEIVLVRQYRYLFGQPVIEIPAGKNEPGQDYAYGAARELREEVGAAGTLIPLGELWSSPGIFTERVHLFLGTGLTFGETDPDPDEYIEILRVPFEKAVEMIMNGEITDSKSVAGILKAKLWLEQNTL